LDKTWQGKVRQRQVGGGAKGIWAHMEDKLLFILVYQKLVFYQFEWHSAADFGDAKWYAKTNSRSARPDHRPSVSDSRSN
jgi:hypothetical protein